LFFVPPTRIRNHIGRGLFYKRGDVIQSSLICKPFFKKPFGKWFIPENVTADIREECHCLLSALVAGELQSQ